MANFAAADFQNLQCNLLRFLWFCFCLFRKLHFASTRFFLLKYQQWRHFTTFCNSCTRVWCSWIEESFGWMCDVMASHASWPQAKKSAGIFKNYKLFQITQSWLDFALISANTKPWTPEVYYVLYGCMIKLHTVQTEQPAEQNWMNRLTEQTQMTQVTEKTKKVDQVVQIQ